MITADKEKIAEFVSRKIDHSSWGNYAALGIEKDGVIVVGVIYNNYTKNVRCSMHGAIEGNHLTREFLWMMFDYAFNKLGCKVIINHVCSTNKKSLKFTKHLGFKQHGEPIKDGTEKGDLILFTLNRDDCKWLANETFVKKHYETP